MDESTGSSALINVVEPAKLWISISTCIDDMVEIPCIILLGKTYTVTLVLTDHANNRIRVDEVTTSTPATNIFFSIHESHAIMIK